LDEEKLALIFLEKHSIILSDSGSKSSSPNCSSFKPTVLFLKVFNNLCNRELLNFRFQWQAGEVPNSAQYKQIRKDIARLKTVLREEELGINTGLIEKKKDLEST